MLLMGYNFYTSFVNGDWRQKKEEEEEEEKEEKEEEKKTKTKKKKKKKKKKKNNNNNNKTKKTMKKEEEEDDLLFCFVLCLTSQQHASVSQGRSCSDNCTCSHTETEVVDLTQPVLSLTL